MKHCLICAEKHYAKGFCRRHYRLFSGEHTKRWEKVKNSSELYSRAQRSQKAWRTKNQETEDFKIKARERQKRHYYTNPNRKAYLKNWKAKQPKTKKICWYARDHDKQYFDGKRKLVLERDGFSCQVCGMDNETHKKLYGLRLAVHHKNKLGRTVSRTRRDNNIDNLETLCFPCHRRADAAVVVK